MHRKRRRELRRWRFPERMERYRSVTSPPPKINTIFLIKSWLEWRELYLPWCFIEINVWGPESNASARERWMNEGRTSVRFLREILFRNARDRAPIRDGAAFFSFFFFSNSNTNQIIYLYTGSAGQRWAVYGHAIGRRNTRRARARAAGDSLKTMVDRQFVSRLSEASSYIRGCPRLSYRDAKFMIPGRHGDKRMST